MRVLLLVLPPTAVLLVSVSDWYYAHRVVLKVVFKYFLFGFFFHFCSDDKAGSASGAFKGAGHTGFLDEQPVLQHQVL